MNCAFALGGLAGSNAHGAGFLQAALDEGLVPDLISCTSGQLLWAYRYLKSLKDGKSLAEYLMEDQEERCRIRDCDIATLAAAGKNKVFKVMPIDIVLKSYRNAYDIAGRLYGGMLEIFLSAWSNKTGNADQDFSSWLERNSFIEAFMNILPCGSLTPIRTQEFFDSLSDEFMNSSIGIVFNSYDPQQGIEYIHLNDRARQILGGINNGRHAFRSRTEYTGISAQYVKDALWLYPYGFINQKAVDGAYFRQIMLSEATPAEFIFVARPINHRWCGDLPKSFLEQLFLQVEINFNGAYQGERDKIKMMNTLLETQIIGRQTALERNYHSVELVEVEIETQRKLFDYVFERQEVFDRARDKAAAAITSARGNFDRLRGARDNCGPRSTDCHNQGQRRARGHAAPGRHDADRDGAKCGANSPRPSDTAASRAAGR